MKNNEGDVKAGDCSKNNNEGDVKHLHGLRGKHLPGAIHLKHQVLNFSAASTYLH